MKTLEKSNMTLNCMYCAGDSLAQFTGIVIKEEATGRVYFEKVRPTTNAITKKSLFLRLYVLFFFLSGWFPVRRVL